MILEILRHSGPARLGLFKINDFDIDTPNFFSIVTPRIKMGHDIYLATESTKTDVSPLLVQYESGRDGAGVLPDLHVGFDVPREMAELAVDETIKLAEKYPKAGAVVQGSKFLDLRVRCTEALRERPLLVIANGRELVENPRLLVDTVTAVRSIASPNTALYFPGAPPHMFYLLAYMGVDFFDTLECVGNARRDRIVTGRGELDLRGLKEIPCLCHACKDKSPGDLAGDFEAILGHNFNACLQIVREIREAIRDNSFRELVEEKAASDVNSMAMLRILDLEKQDFLEKYTAVF